MCIRDSLRIGQIDDGVIEAGLDMGGAALDVQMCIRDSPCTDQSNDLSAISP